MHAFFQLLSRRDPRPRADFGRDRPTRDLGPQEDQCADAATIGPAARSMARRSPSFHCEDRKGRYHCFGCGVSGDHFRFLTDLEGLSFPEAVQQIADMAGVAMPQPDPQAERRETERTTLLDVMELATQFFQDQLQTASGAKARAYLRDRGPDRADDRDLPARLRARQPQCAEGISGDQGRAEGADRGLRAGACTGRTFRSPTTASATASCSRSCRRATG